MEGLDRNELALSKAIARQPSCPEAVRWYVRLAHEDFPGRGNKICQHAMGKMILLGSEYILTMIDAMMSRGEKLPPHVLWLMCKEGFLQGAMDPNALHLMQRILDEEGAVAMYEVESTLLAAEAVECMEVVELLSLYISKCRAAQAVRLQQSVASNEGVECPRRRI